MSGNSVTLWIRDIEKNDQAAAYALFDRYFERVLEHARRKLASDFRRVVDEEDIAVMAFQGCFARISSGKYPPLQDRDELWRLLARISERRVCDVVRKHLSARRGKGQVRGESVFVRSGINQNSDGLGSVPDCRGECELTAQSTEEYDRLMKLLPSDCLRDVARLVLAGYSTHEIAEKLDRTQRTIQRRLRMIQDIWAEDVDPQDNQLPWNSQAA